MIPPANNICKFSQSKSERKERERERERGAETDLRD